MKRLTSHEQEIARAALEKWYGLYLTEEQFRALMDRNPETEKYVKKWGDDTAAREVLIDAIVTEAGLGHWPLNMDSRAYVIDFMQKFAAHCHAQGYTLDFKVLE